MMMVQIECTYCGHKRESQIYDQKSLVGIVCDICNDKNLKFTDISKTKIDYYQGCPPFPESREEKEEKKDPDRDDDWMRGLY